MQHFKNFFFKPRHWIVFITISNSGFMVANIIMAQCVAKFFINMAFSSIYVYSAELFPTVVRYRCVLKQLTFSIFANSTPSLSCKPSSRELQLFR